jgi:hypothetical protein
MLCAASPLLAKGDLTNLSNPPCPPFSKGGDPKNAFLPKEKTIVITYSLKPITPKSFIISTRNHDTRDCPEIHF